MNNSNTITMNNSNTKTMNTKTMNTTVLTPELEREMMYVEAKLISDTIDIARGREVLAGKDHSSRLLVGFDRQARNRFHRI